MVNAYVLFLLGWCAQSYAESRKLGLLTIKYAWAYLEGVWGPPIITLRYLTLLTSCMACPLMVYNFCRATSRINMHFAALSDIPPWSHQTGSVPRSFCKASWSDNYIIDGTIQQHVERVMPRCDIPLWPPTPNTPSAKVLMWCPKVCFQTCTLYTTDAMQKFVKYYESSHQQSTKWPTGDWPETGMSIHSVSPGSPYNNCVQYRWS